MVQQDPTPDESPSTAAVPTALRSQYHAALAMLRQAVERCPESLWTSGGHPCSFWHIAYHTLFFAHLYMQPNEAAFRPWEHHREEYQFLGRLPWPPHDPPRIGAPYTKREVLEYWEFCDRMVDSAVDAIDLGASDCGFWWYQMPKAEHQIMNIRHVQHHAAQLADRLRPVAAVGVDWIGTGRGEEPNKAG